MGRKGLELVEVVDSSDRPVTTLAIELDLPGRGQMVSKTGVWMKDTGFQDISCTTMFIGEVPINAGVWRRGVMSWPEGEFGEVELGLRGVSSSYDDFAGVFGSELLIRAG